MSAIDRELNKNRIEILDPEAVRNDPTNLTVVMHEEDHTIGNALKHILCQMSEVEFCGYNVPHPLEDKILIRIQTRQGVEAKALLIKAFDDLQRIYKMIKMKFEESIIPSRA